MEENLYKEVIFSCSHPRYRVLSGRVPYWVVKKNNCLSMPCPVSRSKGCRPELQISETSFVLFRNDIKKFDLLISSLSSREVEFTAGVKAVKSIFQIAEVEGRPRRGVIEGGIAVCLNEPLLNGKLFSGDINVILDNPKDYTFSEGDTVLGKGTLSFQETGMILISNVTRIRKVLSNVEGQEHAFAAQGDRLKPSNPLAENICESCEYSVFVKISQKQALFTQKVYSLFCRNSHCVMELKDIFSENFVFELERTMI